MASVNSYLNRRVAPSEITDNKTIVSTSAVVIDTTAKTPHLPITLEFLVIWLDPNVSDADNTYQNLISRFQLISSAIHTFTNLNDCTQFLDTIKNEKIIMVISNDFLQEIWLRIKSMPQVHSIYIISKDGEKKVLSDLDSDKVKGIFTKTEPISTPVKRDNNQYEQGSLIMSIIPSIKYIKKDLKHLNRVFMYWMMVKLIIIQEKYEGEAHKEALKNLVECSRNQYSTDDTELKIIDEFEQSYHKHSPIWWFTRNCFISLMLSRAFRTQDTEMIVKMGFFIKDLYQQLQSLQGYTLKTSKLPITVYRSQNISDVDFEKIKNIKGNLLSLNSFITANRDYERALNLVRRVQNVDAGIGIIFAMKIESRHTATSFTSIENISYSTDEEKSILFFMHSIFRITDMKQIEDRVWQIDLTLTANNDERVTSLTELLRDGTRGVTGWLKLAELFSIVRDFDQAKEIYYLILGLTSEKDPLKAACIFNELGIIDDERGDYASALSFYQKAIEIRQQQLPANYRSISVSYNNIGEVQRQMGDYYNSLSTHQKTLNMKKKILPPDDLSLATAYNNIGELERSVGNFSSELANQEKALSIRLKKYSPTDASLAVPYNNLGLIHRELGNYPIALSYLQKSLDVKLKTFPPLHPSLTFTYNNIGDLSQQMGEYSNALSSYQKALEIQEKVFAQSHPEITTTYTNMGAAHQSMGNYATALSLYHKAVEIRLKTLPASHPSLGTCYNNIGHAHQLMGEYNTAFEYYQKTLRLQETSLRVNHPSLAPTYNNLADVQRKLGNSTKALILYRKSLDIKKKSLPPHHPALITTYNNIGVLHQSMKNYPAALECFRQTLEIQAKTLPGDHPDLAAIYNNMGVTNQSMKDYSKALEYYKKSLEIQEKALPPTHPEIGTTHNSLATVFVNLGDYKSALEHEERAVQIATQALAPDHPNIQTFQNYLDRIRMKIEST